MAVRTVFYHFAVHKLPNFPVQDRLEVCLALLGSLYSLRLGFSSEWLKEHSQLTGFNRSLPKMAAKSKRVRNKADFVQQSNRITVIYIKLVFVQVILIPLLNCFISVSDQDSELYPQFSTRIDIPEIETESGFHSGSWKVLTSTKIPNWKKQNTQISIS